MAMLPKPPCKKKRKNPTPCPHLPRALRLLLDEPREAPARVAEALRGMGAALKGSGISPPRPLGEVYPYSEGDLSGDRGRPVPPPGDTWLKGTRAWATTLATLLGGYVLEDDQATVLPRGWICLVRRESDGGIVTIGADGIKTYAGPVTLGLGNHDTHIPLK